MFWKTFRWSFVITIASLITAYFYGSWTALFLCIILGLLEVSLSFDNAVLNATILRRMSHFWQQIFLTVGIFIAVFGMRLIFPLLIVGIAANINPVEAFQLALQKGDPHEPGTYGYIFASIHPVVAAFGSMFLLMLFLTFIFEEREVKWLKWIEAPLAKLGQIPMISVAIAIGALYFVSNTLGVEKQAEVLTAGLLGIVLFIVIHGLSHIFKQYSEDQAKSVALATGKAGFLLFLYLEVLDATLSFDGAIGAFAVTADPIIIALGLGLIGAIFVRSLTVYMVKRKTLENLIYLEHGAHWAIGALAVILLTSIMFHVNEIITGLIGIVFIGAAFASSMLYNKRKHQAAAAKKAAKTSKI